ncbi:MAG: cation:proton antiporter [Clostridiales bacterium]|nr:cation:proton antiporter [Clostridiales bacterium]
MINTLLAIAIALLLGLLMTRLMKLIGLPNVTGYLIVGLIIGPHALGIINLDTYEGLKVISTVALGFIGFSIGEEFKLSSIKQIGKSTVAITFFQALAATLFVDLALLTVHWIAPDVMSSSEAIIMGAIATATAPAATLMVVRQYKAKGVVTDTLLPVVALDDAIGLIVFAISNSIALSLASGKSLTVMDIAVWPIVEIVVSLVVGGLLGLLLSVVPRFFKSRDNRTIASILCVFASLGVCVLFEYMQEKGWIPFALSDLLVCMMVGATFVNMRKNDAPKMIENTDHWTPALLMLFFILSGAELDVRMFFEDPLILICIVVYVIFRCAGKYLGTMAGAAVAKSDKNVRNYLGIMLFPQAGVSIGMATVCSAEFTKAGMPEIGQKIVTITMCAVFIYELVGPILTKWSLVKVGEILPEHLGRKHQATVGMITLGRVSDSAMQQDLQDELAVQEEVQDDAISDAKSELMDYAEGEGGDD